MGVQGLCPGDEPVGAPVVEPEAGQAGPGARGDVCGRRQRALGPREGLELASHRSGPRGSRQGLSSLLVEGGTALELCQPLRGLPCLLLQGQGLLGLLLTG